MLLHPRQPPLIRSMPHVESLSLFKAQESLEETEALAAQGIVDVHSQEHVVQGNDVTMADPIIPIAPAIVTSTPQAPEIKMSEVATAIAPAESGAVIEPTLQQETRIANSLSAAKPPPAQPEEPLFPMQSKPMTMPMPVPSTVYQPAVLSQPENDDDEDQEMPSINMESDSDEEED